MHLFGESRTRVAELHLLREKTSRFLSLLQSGFIITETQIKASTNSSQTYQSKNYAVIIRAAAGHAADDVFRAIYDAGAVALNETPDSWIEERNARYQRRRERILAKQALTAAMRG